MPKKTPPKNQKGRDTTKKTGNPVVSMVDKIHDKTEKQLVGFVKELVKQKRKKTKMAQKLKKDKADSEAKTSKKPNKSNKSNKPNKSPAPQKKKDTPPPRLTLVPK
jgi:hypothetical protein